MLGELTILAVDRFWRVARNLVCGDSRLVETSLAEFVNLPDATSSKAWGAILLHAISMEPALIGGVISALQEREPGAPPPKALALVVGFASRDFDAKTMLADPREILTSLQRSSLLSHQAVAEIVLAFAGNKMSRVTGHSTLVAEIARILNIPFFIGSQSITPISDANLNGFSNRSIPGERIATLSGDFDVYAYFGGDLADQALLSVLDQLGAAGKYLGIPPCCRAYFSETWEVACREDDGDLAFRLMSSQPQWKNERKIDIAWQCNPYGMYFGGGLTWHFPCSLSCAATIDMIDMRFDRLSDIDAAFADECRSFQERSFTLLPDRTTTSEAHSSRGMLIRAIAPSRG